MFPFLRAVFDSFGVSLSHKVRPRQGRCSGRTFFSRLHSSSRKQPLESTPCRRYYPSSDLESMMFCRGRLAPATRFSSLIIILTLLSSYLIPVPRHANQLSSTLTQSILVLFFTSWSIISKALFWSQTVISISLYQYAYWII